MSPGGLGCRAALARRLVLVLLGALILHAVLFAAPAAAGVAASTATRAASTITGDVTMVSQPGDSVGEGQSYLFDSSNGPITITGGVSWLEVQAGGFQFEFAPPSGQRLQVGEYTGAQEWPLEPAQDPGLIVQGNGRCNYDYGNFTIKDIATDADGNVDRLWLLYEQECNGPSGPVLFGEIRIGELSSTAAEIVEPAAVQWPSTHSGGPYTTVPVTVVAGSAGADISSDTIGGSDPGDFTVLGDGCSGVVLAANARCTVDVAFEPTTDGTRTAELDVTDAFGVVTAIPLSGTGVTSSDSLTIVSEPGDVVGDGKDYLLDGQTGSVYVSGGLGKISVTAYGADETPADGWELVFTPPSGQLLGVGQYVGAQRWPFEPAVDPGLSVTGPDGYGCDNDYGQFTIKDIGTDAQGNVPPRTAR